MFIFIHHDLRDIEISMHIRDCKKDNIISKKLKKKHE